MDEEKRGQKGKTTVTSTSTDLGVIQVRSRGDTDVVMLTHNRKVIFTIHCVPGKTSVLAIAPEFFDYSHDQWDAVYKTYVRWKRQTMPQFTMPQHSGRTKDHHEHPWRKKQAGPAPNIKRPKNQA